MVLGGFGCEVRLGVADVLRWEGSGGSRGGGRVLKEAVDDRLEVGNAEVLFGEESVEGVDLSEERGVGGGGGAFWGFGLRRKEHLTPSSDEPIEV